MSYRTVNVVVVLVDVPLLEAAARTWYVPAEPFCLLSRSLQTASPLAFVFAVCVAVTPFGFVTMKVTCSVVVYDRNTVAQDGTSLARWRDHLSRRGKPQDKGGGGSGSYWDR